MKRVEEVERLICEHGVINRCKNVEEDHPQNPVIVSVVIFAVYNYCCAD